MLIYITIIGGLVISVIGSILIRSVSSFLGASGELLENCVLYGRILFLSLTPYMLQNVFQSFFVTAEKPKLGLYVIIAAGLTNMLLDFLFIAVFKWGLAGAALATAASEYMGGFLPVFYFLRKNGSLLRLGKTHFDKGILRKTCTNGSSELMTNLSMSVVNSLYNFQLIRFSGEDGVAAYGTIMYVNFFFAAVFFGYSIGSAPVIGYHYGAGNHDELKNLFKKSLSLIAVWGILLTLLAHLLAAPLAAVFVGYDKELFAMTCHGFRLYSMCFLICGFNFFASSFFTALSNGAVSAAISFLRTLVFQIAAVCLLPFLFGIDGIWLAVTAAEAMTLLITVTFFIRNQKRYHYA